jgi:hypothetical protein
MNQSKMFGTTNLSLYLFAMVAMPAYTEASCRAGDGTKEDLKLLELFSEQTRQAESNFRLFPMHEEYLNDDVTSFIVPEEQNKE